MKLLRKYIQAILQEDTERADAFATEMEKYPELVGTTVRSPGPAKSEFLRDTLRKGRTLKQAFAKYVDRSFLESLITVHWVDETSLFEQACSNKLVQLA